MTSIAEAPSCPRCGETMVLKTAGRGSYAGQQFWACPRFPKCWGTRGIPGQDVTAPVVGPEFGATPNVAGASAQAIFERRLAAQRRRARALWPVAVGITVVLMVLIFIIGISIGLPWLGATGATIVAIAMLYLVVDRPQFVDAWRIGAEGERKTSDRLGELKAEGFIVLDDRQAPGYGGNIDHFAVGPTGVWVIETKSLKGSVDLTGNRLTINDHLQDKVVQQVYREATAVQIALREVLSSIGVGVIPVLCLHRAKLPFFDRDVQGVTLTSGRTLVKTIRGAPRALSPEQVDQIAQAAERILPRARTR